MPAHDSPSGICVFGSTNELASTFAFAPTVTPPMMTARMPMVAPAPILTGAMTRKPPCA